MSKNYQIEIRNIYKVFGSNPTDVMSRIKAGASKTEILEQTAHVVGLNDVSLSIEAGHIYVIMGLSGSGKSTLIRHFNRLIDPTSGQVIVDGKNVMEFGKKELEAFRRNKISMVFQRFGLLPHETVLSNAAFGLKVQGVAKAEREKKALYWLEQVGLAGVESHYPSQLSGGMQQRVGLARALVNDPDILLMDEAFSALDPLIKSEMQDQLLVLQKKLNKTIVFITHDLDEALKIGDRIAILKDGELIQEGTPSDILMKPANGYVEEFIGGVNRSKAIRVGHLMRSAAMTMASGAEPFNQGRFDATHAVRIDQTLEEILPQLISGASSIPVIDASNALVGYLDKTDVIAALKR
ncbi:glycine betaine/L-proline ABC transporter ATP-binding protein [uncultured Oceanisphaera sp.]|uniref:quaternary amine ABC transporter ATP-binding protein n=1 Tax=uncultured Oceanisphaera sp. TaxID=353858 RepID=UPI00260C25FB|nr:glycine betaine/L-proline ABC transporter ATP-binding protein [uncultured Oceanisphaera sp.]